MTKSLLKHRLATRADLPALTALMDRAISELQKPFLTAEQIGSSRTIMGLDTQLIEDKTYFVIEQDGAIAGCGAGAVAQRSMGATVRRAGMQPCWTRRPIRPGCVPCTHIPISCAVVLVD